MIRELTQDDFDAIAAELNNRPRQTLAFKAVRRVPAFWVQAPVQLRSGSGIRPDPRTICRVSRRQLIHVPVDGLELHRTFGPCGKETASQRSARHTTSWATSQPSESRDHPPRTPDRPAHTTMTDPSLRAAREGRIEPGQRLA